MDKVFRFLVPVVVVDCKCFLFRQSEVSWTVVSAFD